MTGFYLKLVNMFKVENKNIGTPTGKLCLSVYRSLRYNANFFPGVFQYFPKQLLFNRIVYRSYSSPHYRLSVCNTKYWRRPTKSFQIKATCDALRDLVPFVQFKKREKQPWRCLTFVKVTFFHGCFSRFVNCINAIKSREKSYKWKFNALQRYCLSIPPENTRKPLEFQGV